VDEGDADAICVEKSLKSAKVDTDRPLIDTRPFGKMR